MIQGWQKLQSEDRLLNMVQDQLSGLVRSIQKAFTYADTNKVVRGKLTIGAAGAVSASVFDTGTLTSAVWLTTGVYQLTLSSAFRDLSMCLFSFELSSASFSGQVGYKTATNTVYLYIFSAGLLTDPPNGSKVAIKLELVPSS